MCATFAHNIVFAAVYDKAHTQPHHCASSSLSSHHHHQQCCLPPSLHHPPSSSFNNTPNHHHHHMAPLPMAANEPFAAEMTIHDVYHCFPVSFFFSFFSSYSIVLINCIAVFFREKTQQKRTDNRSTDPNDDMQCVLSFP